jgi:hypothetical protein
VTSTFRITRPWFIRLISESVHRIGFVFSVHLLPRSFPIPDGFPPLLEGDELGSAVVLEECTSVHCREFADESAFRGPRRRERSRTAASAARQRDDRSRSTAGTVSAAMHTISTRSNSNSPVQSGSAAATGRRFAWRWRKVPSAQRAMQLRSGPAAKYSGASMRGSRWFGPAGRPFRYRRIRR